MKLWKIYRVNGVVQGVSKKNVPLLGTQKVNHFRNYTSVRLETSKSSNGVEVWGQTDV